MKILVVDDHTFNRDLLRFILEDEGHYCVEAGSGSEAIGMFEDDHTIDMILMDVNMPGISGIEAAREIRKRSNDRPVTIIFVTALDDADVISRCLDAGGDDFVPKPVNEPILVSKLNAHQRNIDNYKKLLNANRELRLHEQATRRELSIVENIFQNSTSSSRILCKNLTSYTSAMSLFNGDLVLTAPSPAGGQYLVIGDFTGHGLSAAVGSLPVISIFSNLVKRQCSVSELAAELNSQLYHVLPLGMFFCATLIHMDRDGKRLAVWSGGMNDLLCLSPDGSRLDAYPGTHMPLGILTEEEFDSRCELIEPEPESLIYIYTDGVNEATNANGEQFGEDRIKYLLRHTPQDRIKRLVAEVHDFASSTQDDDISVVELRCAPCVHIRKTTGEPVDMASAYHAVECFPWDMSMTLAGEDLQRTDPVNQLVAFLGTLQGVELHEDRLFTIISELYNNALEHGVLALDSALKSTPDGFDEYYRLRAERLAACNDGEINIRVRYLRGTPNRVELQISDSGSGFDHGQLPNSIRDNEASHGRGIGLLRSLCSSLEYSDGGRTVTAWYDFTL